MEDSIVLSRTGQKMPLVGLGTWKIPNDVCADVIYEAIKVGYRLLDGAFDYGNEREAGEGVRRAITDGLVTREELFITTKLWNTFHAKEYVKESAKYQLHLWGLEYFDLFLVHFPISLEYVDPKEKYPTTWHGLDDKVHPVNVPLQETWTSLEELVDEGVAKNIGISNCQGSLLIDILRYARYPPQVLQVERHPYLTQEPLVELCKTLGIAITAYSSFGPQGYIEINMDKGQSSLLSHNVVAELASKHKKSPAQVLLRWSTQRGLAVIPKATTTQYLTENLASTAFNLDETDIKSISALNINLRLNDPVEIDPRLGIFA